MAHSLDSNDICVLCSSVGLEGCQLLYDQRREIREAVRKAHKREASNLGALQCKICTERSTSVTLNAMSDV